MRGAHMIQESEAAPRATRQDWVAALGRAAYRAGAMFLIFLGCAAAGGAIGLASVGSDAEGFDALGAAIWGMLVGSVVGVILAVEFLFLPLPQSIVTRLIIVAAFAILFCAALGIQGLYD